MFYCAQLDADGIVHTVCELSRQIINTNIIPLAEYDVSLTGKKYNPETKTFEEITQNKEIVSETLEQKVDRIETDIAEIKQMLQAK